jgi:Zn-dependent metalloprotease
MGNGLRTSSIHTNDAASAAAFGASTLTGGSAESHSPRLDPETAARSYIDQAFGSPALGFAAEAATAAGGEFKTLGSETVPLTSSQTVKFRQYIRKIPVYGSLVTVEMDENNQLLSINSAVGEPEVDPVASISPRDALETVRKATSGGSPREEEEDSEAALGGADVTPRLNYYYDDEHDTWRLVYLVENVHDLREKDGHPHLFNFLVDAHTGDIVRQVPRSACADFEGEPALAETTVVDENGRPRVIAARLVDGTRHELHDEKYNVHTYDFGFADAVHQKSRLPGSYVTNPPEWAAPAVSAHANACEVARYVAEVLKRNGLDNRGGKYVSSINCTYNGSGREWRNAAWIGSQMIYGQRMVGGELKSYARALDVVAHEIFHGITERSANLEYLGETGALNESYSDIFGVLVSNHEVADPAQWNWELGEELGGSGKRALRDLRNPTAFDQPGHMDDFRKLPHDAAGDWGGVHINSGIHNHAAYLLLTARADGRMLRDHEDGPPLFDSRTGGAVFYIALTQHLSPRSLFADSRRAVTLAIQSLFRNDPRREAALSATADAFLAVGIV